MNERQNDCGAVSMPKGSIRTLVVTFDIAKHFISPTETHLHAFSVAALQHKL